MNSWTFPKKIKITLPFVIICHDIYKYLYFLSTQDFLTVNWDEQHPNPNQMRWKPFSLPQSGEKVSLEIVFHLNILLFYIYYSRLNQEWRFLLKQFSSRRYYSIFVFFFDSPLYRKLFWGTLLKLIQMLLILILWNLSSMTAFRTSSPLKGWLRGGTSNCFWRRVT